MLKDLLRAMLALSCIPLLLVLLLLTLRNVLSLLAVLPSWWPGKVLGRVLAYPASRRWGQWLEQWEDSLLRRKSMQCLLWTSESKLQLNAGLQRSDKMLCLWECGQHNMMLTVSL